MRTLLVAALFFAIANVHAEEMLFGDIEKGKVLHGRDCVACHDHGMYTRPNHLKSLPGLERQIELCSDNLKKDYSDDDQADLIIYLNDAYYKF